MVTEKLVMKRDWNKQRDETLASQRQEMKLIQDQIDALASKDYSQLFAPLPKVETLTGQFAMLQRAQ